MANPIIVIGGASSLTFAAPVQDIDVLASLPPAQRQDKQTRLVEDEGTWFFFDEQSSAGDVDGPPPVIVDTDGVVIPDDDPATGRWIKITAAAMDHGSLLGLGDPDHPRYVDKTIVGTIVAVHTFNPSSAGAAFILGVNASGQLINALNADLLDGSHANQTAASGVIPIGKVGGKLDIAWLSEVLSLVDLTDVTGTTGSGTVLVLQASPTFNPSVAGAPFIIGPNASGQLVTFFNSDMLDGYHATPTPSAFGIPVANGSNKIAIGWISELLSLSDLLDVTATTGSGTVVVLQNTPILLTPTINNFTNAQHDHSSAASGSQISHTNITNSASGDPHIQYSLVDGTRGFTGAVSGITPTSPNHLTTKGYIDSIVPGSGVSETFDWDADPATGPSMITNGDSISFELPDGSTKAVVGHAPLPSGIDFTGHFRLVVYYAVSTPGPGSGNISLRGNFKYIAVGELMTKANDETITLLSGVTNTDDRLHRVEFNLNPSLMAENDFMSCKIERLGLTDAYNGNIAILEVGRLDFMR